MNTYVTRVSFQSRFRSYAMLPKSYKRRTTCFALCKRKNGNFKETTVFEERLEEKRRQRSTIDVFGGFPEVRP